MAAVDGLMCGLESFEIWHVWFNLDVHLQQLTNSLQGLVYKTRLLGHFKNDFSQIKLGSGAWDVNSLENEVTQHSLK